MSFLQFDKTQLINLEYSLSKEIILANPSGAYASSTIVGCNTRKYHGLLIAPVDEIDGGRHVFLSSLDETILQHDQEFHLGIHRYPGEYHPKGHKYARWFEMDPIWKLVYRVGGVVLHKDIILDEKDPRVYIRYILQEAHSATDIRIKPFLAFRNIHKLSKANLLVNPKVEACRNGISMKLYSGYPRLYMQASRALEFVPAPDWYLNIEYLKEQRRGYDFHEDLFVPGFFQTRIKTGESIVLSAGLEEVAPAGIKRRFVAQVAKVPLRHTFEEVLAYTARSFLILPGGEPEIVSGYHWLGAWGRNCWIALPGLTLATGHPESFETIARSLTKRLRKGLFPNHSPDRNKPIYRNVDGSLWMIWALNQFVKDQNNALHVWEVFGKSIREVLNAYRDGINPGIHMQEDGLLFAYLPDLALTWMSAYVDGKPVTQRPGLDVEINALWYNAICFALELADAAGDKGFIKRWKTLPVLIQASFTTHFWDPEKNYLADYVFNGETHWDVRPNQLIAAAVPHSPLTDEQKHAVLECVQSELLTPKGIRTLSPRHDDFKASFEGDPVSRDLAYHQGTVRPWLLGFFGESWLNLYEKSGKHFIQALIRNFEEDLFEHGLGTLSEVYDGSLPHAPCGAVSSAASVAEILRLIYLLKKY